MSLRDQILSANDAALHPVEVPEWGCTVYVPVLTLDDDAAVKKAAAAADTRVAAAVFAIRDADGRQVFSDDDGPALARKSMAVVNRVIAAFNRVNGFGEDVEKKSPTTPASASN